MAALYGRLSHRTAKIRHLPPAVLYALGTVLKPFHPGVSRIMVSSAIFDKADQSFDPRLTLKDYPVTLTRLEDFIRERVAEAETAQER